MKYNDNGEYKDIYIKTFDTLPVGAIVEYDGETIPDGWSEIADPNTYSDTEVRIGTWYDKPLYRKIITIPALGNNTDVYGTIDSNINIKKYDVYIENIIAHYKVKLPITGQNSVGTYIDYPNNRITVQTTSDRTAFTNNYAIIEYTKTTD